MKQYLSEKEKCIISDNDWSYLNMTKTSNMEMFMPDKAIYMNS